MEPCGAPETLSIEQALAKQNNAIDAVTDVEQVVLLDSFGRVIAESIIAPINVPRFDNSMMDGFALKAADSQQPLKIVSQVPAGHSFCHTLSRTAKPLKFSTGAPLPNGADAAVIMQEETSTENTLLICNTKVKVGQCIRKAGEDIEMGTILVTKGTVITAAHLSLLASVGVTSVNVFRKLKVAILATGDELVEPATPLTSGKFTKVIKPASIAMLQKLPVEILDFGIVKDDLEEIRQAFRQASQTCDWIISSGGVSVGDADFVKQILREQGNRKLLKVAIKPGRPYAFGRVGDAWFSGLPGNPVSSFITFMQSRFTITAETLWCKNIQHHKSTKQYWIFLSRAAQGELSFKEQSCGIHQTASYG